VTLIAIENRSILTVEDYHKLVEALSEQTKDFNTSPWVEHGYCKSIEVVALSTNACIPPGAWVIELLNTSDQEGALGYHESKVMSSTSDGPQKASDHSTRGVALHPLGHEIPLAKVFVQTSQQDGVEPTEVASHELLEMVVDPWVNQPALVAHDGKQYIVEVCDPVQGNGYQAPNGQTLADFCWPAWFGKQQTRTALSQRESVHEPFVLAPQGYISVFENGSWTQIQGG